MLRQIRCCKVLKYNQVENLRDRIATKAFLSIKLKTEKKEDTIEKKEDTIEKKEDTIDNIVSNAMSGLKLNDKIGNIKIDINDNVKQQILNLAMDKAMTHLGYLRMCCRTVLITAYEIPEEIIFGYPTLNNLLIEDEARY
jgi:DNA-directed RNA polymerase subunit N (RpoN/RPB10)